MTSLSARAEINTVELKESTQGAELSIKAISTDGNVVAAFTYDKPEDAIWSGENWKNQIDLLPLDSTKGDTWVYALNYDGSIAAGYSDNYDMGTQAMIWYGANWQSKIGLTSLRTSGLGFTSAYALSDKGDIVGGVSLTNENAHHAVLWYGNQWQEKKELESLIYRDAAVKALSANGRIAAGVASDNSDIIKGSEDIAEEPTEGTTVIGNLVRANAVGIVWFGDNWQNAITLPSLKQDKSGYSIAKKLSSDGNIAVGNAVNEGEETRATVWTNSGDWSHNITAISLPSLNLNNTGNSGANVISYNAKIIGGYSDSTLGKSTATIWYGKNWENTIELPAIGEYQFSEVTALSGDGKVAAGSFYDGSKNRGLLWTNYLPEEEIDKLEITDNTQLNQDTSITSPETITPAVPNESTSSVNPEIPTQTEKSAELNESTNSDISKKTVVVVDVLNTQQTLQEMGSDTFRLVALQNASLKHLLDGCYVERGFCYRVINDFRGESRNKAQDLGLRFGYGFGNGFSAGISFDRTLYQALPESYRRNSDNLGLGLFARYELSLAQSRIYIAPAFAWDSYQVTTSRNILTNTEAATGSSKIKGLAYSLTVGQDFTLNNSSLGWYLSLRHNEIKRTGYQESQVSFPVEYADLTYNDTTLAIGAKGKVALTPKLSWLIGAELEQRLDGKEAHYQAKANYIGNFDYALKSYKTRYQSYTGIAYQFSPTFNIEVKPYMGRNEVGKVYYGGQLNFSGQF